MNGSFDGKWFEQEKQKLEPQHVSKCQNDIAKTRVKTVQGKHGNYQQTIGGRTTAYQARALMVQAFNTAVRWRTLISNPAAVVEPIRPDVPEYTILEPDETAHLLEITLEHNPWLYALLYSEFDGGMRPGELRGFAIEHRRIRHKETVLEVRRTARQTSSKLTPDKWFGPCKTKRSRRDVSLNNETVEILDMHGNIITEHRKKNIITYKDHGILFPSRAGTPMHGQNLNDDLGMLCKRAGLPRMTPHDIRHTAISLMIYAGMDPQAIADRVGHANAAFTMTRYAHIFKVQRRAEANISLMTKLGVSKALEL